jgi:hypothetical protein
VGVRQALGSNMVGLSLGDDTDRRDDGPDLSLHAMCLLP